MRPFHPAHPMPSPDPDDPRRRFLIRALGLGAVASGGLWLPDRGGSAESSVNHPAGTPSGRWPRRFGPGPSVFRRRGRVRVNGQTVYTDTLIPADATIETGSDSELVFAVGPDAFLARENTRLELVPRARSAGDGEASVAEEVIDDVVSGLRAVTGKVISTFGVREAGASVTAETPTATVGIRGTGIYLEAARDQAYVCTCYGEARVQPKDQPDRAETIRSTHHEARYIRTEGPSDRRIEKAPSANHTDGEVALLDALLARKPPFAAAE